MRVSSQNGKSARSTEVQHGQRPAGCRHRRVGPVHGQHHQHQCAQTPWVAHREGNAATPLADTPITATRSTPSVSSTQASKSAWRTQEASPSRGNGVRR